mmetsp:Transcript_24091/g.56801  ORF Transcript_24091/g.56801 Transcript_24091/m.56801 type:complete len:804 (+) Transcript_24091:361-2772(+)|eukprot:CAMPEP_0197199286 /NCGR_PEP_ID=MMETSP1423-20130617/33807_1 /TAXON_ID=476441 /ORGANISM="Pseudo-nitzschia heimii, Strain UNC1101" /LENGTH=803 /DNA_ID=CAMNT_0042653141 /DNA_START=281 /DNA_END=2692 /DNA_ORIENTATION=-
MSSSSRISATQSAPGAIATTTVTASFDTTTKKKFGKNLNKLTAPPVIPVSHGNTKLNSSSKNGFLLLSTKRASSGNNSATASGGILSSKSAQTTAKPIPNLGLHTEFASSTHDALLGVVVGASRLESHQQPDAWGVAEKQQQQHQQEQEQSQNDRAQNYNESPTVFSVRSMETKSHEGNFSIDEKITVDSVAVGKIEEHQTQLKDLDRNNSNGVRAEFRTSNWDEYGGRHFKTKEDNISIDEIGNKPSNDDQGAFMTKLARQRAEKKRDEEQNRMLEQKERAAQRLRELEEKMAVKKKEISAIKTVKMLKLNESDGLESKSRSRIVLEKLKQKDNAATNLSTTPARTQRTLYDPNTPGKSYSSLVSGSLSTKQEKIPKVSEQMTKTQQLPVSSAKKNGIQSQQGTYAADPESFDRQYIIQVANYEDLDRGDRNPSTAPRMLFDPKSGSMIEVTSRDECATSGRNRKVGKKNKNSREKHAKKDVPIDIGNCDSKGRRKFKGSNKETNLVNHRAKGTGSEPALSMKQDKKVKIADPRKLPRTCGVLYSRDKKGGFFCSDGCEGDLGYGVHSVPGGRIKNSQAYSKYIDCQKQVKEEVVITYDGINHDDVTLETGFHISEVKDTKHEWIKPNQKIELITGDDESPTLQATAREWAPRHSAFALSEREKITLSDDDEDKEEELGEDDVAPLGLGFDPALNMDSVMQSPSIDPSEGLSAVDLTSLSLEPALQGPAKNSHIFAFESGATWGASNADANNDWGLHSGSTYGTGAKNGASVPTPFLSLSSGNTWGGFGNSLHGESSKSTGE